MIDINKEVPLFASRLNSMGSRRDHWTVDNSVLDWIARKGLLKGSTLLISTAHNIDYIIHVRKIL